MRTAIVRIVLGLLLVSFAACSEKSTKPKMDDFDPKADLSKSKAETPPLPPPPKGGPGGQ
jgi:hypothetical protein